jgi:hypothetical protein
MTKLLTPELQAEGKRALAVADLEDILEDMLDDYQQIEGDFSRSVEITRDGWVTTLSLERKKDDES